MKIIIKNPEDGRALAEKIGNQLIAELLHRWILSKPEEERPMEYEKIIKMLEDNKV